MYVHQKLCSIFNIFNIFLFKKKFNVAAPLEAKTPIVITKPKKQKKILTMMPATMIMMTMITMTMITMMDSIEMMTAMVMMNLIRVKAGITMMMMMMMMVVVLLKLWIYMENQ